MATWKSLDQYAPFAQILVRYMWDARPPLNPNQLAIRAGVRRQVLSQWLNAPSTAELHPDPGAVVKVARAMGVSVSELLIAAGHATEADPLLDRPGAWEYVLHRIEASPPFAPGGEHDGSEHAAQWDEPTSQRVLAFLRTLAAADEAAHRASVSSALSPKISQDEVTDDVPETHDTPHDDVAARPADAPDAATGSTGASLA